MEYPLHQLFSVRLNHHPKLFWRFLNRLCWGTFKGFYLLQKQHFFRLTISSRYSSMHLDTHQIGVTVILETFVRNWYQELQLSVQTASFKKQPYSERVRFYQPVLVLVIIVNDPLQSRQKAISCTDNIYRSSASREGHNAASSTGNNNLKWSLGIRINKRHLSLSRVPIVFCCRVGALPTARG